MLSQNLRSPAPPQAVSLARPLLRGWLHAAAAVGAALLTVALCWRSHRDVGHLLALGIFGLTATELYSVSAIFHLRTWRAPRWRLLRTLDHASIFTAIAGAFTPFGVLAFQGWERTALLASVWGLALVGIGLKIWVPYMSRSASTGLYVGLGWIAALGMPAIAAMLPWQAVALMLAGGVLYSLGAGVYVWRRPDPLPRIFGYHEVFHALVIGGNAALALVILRWLGA